MRKVLAFIFLALAGSAITQTISTCDDYANNPDYMNCQKQLEDVYLACVAECDIADVSCSSACAREFDFNIQER